jgi:hypothetical protein
MKKSKFTEEQIASHRGTWQIVPADSPTTCAGAAGAAMRGAPARDSGYGGTQRISARRNATSISAPQRSRARSAA